MHTSKCDKVFWVGEAEKLRGIDARTQRFGEDRVHEARDVRYGIYRPYESDHAKAMILSVR